MRVRAVALLIQNESIAVMERFRGGRHYYTFPGGGADAGEAPAQAVVREVEEELGIQIRVLQHVATVWFNGNRQEYFLVEQTGGTFGTGSGEEFADGYDETHGTYHPMWMPIRELLAEPVLPEEVALMVVKFHQRGWPDSPVKIREARKNG